MEFSETRFSPSDISNIDLRRLQAFILAAKTQSFGTAAQSLNVVPSAISHGIRSLETELGCTLFQRKGPKVTLTRAGFRLFPFANEVLNRIHDLRDAAKTIQNQGETLRLSVPELLCSCALPQILPEFQECLPQVTLYITHTFTDQDAWQSLRLGQTDLAFCVTDETPKDVQQRKVFDESLHFYSIRTHPLLDEEQVNPAMLQSHLVLTGDADAQSRMNHWFATRGVQEPPLQWSLPSIESVRQMTLASNAIGLMPAWATLQGHAMNEPPLLPISPHSFSLERTWSACSAINSPLSWAAEVLIGLIELHSQEMHERIEVLPS